MEEHEYIAYKGSAFTIEWFRTRNGKCPALEYYRSLGKASRIKLLYLFKRMGDTGKISDTTEFN